MLTELPYGKETVTLSTSCSLWTLQRESLELATMGTSYTKDSPYPQWIYKMSGATNKGSRLTRVGVGLQASLAQHLEQR